MSPIDSFLPRTRIAYISMEIALRSEIHSYAGGLGVLAGDTARSAADLALPIVFVTLASREGYLRQEIDGEGRQTEQANPWEPQDWAEPLDAMIAVRIEGRPVWVRPWIHLVESSLGGAVPVLLLDTRLEANDLRDRAITDRLYGGDDIARLKQEVVLGIGGERMLHALGFAIDTFHLNEGHAALLAAARLRHYALPRDRLTGAGPSYDIARVREECIFTTHTPVEAGHDRFDYADVERLIPGFLPTDELRRLAGDRELNMTQLALSLSGFVNGVARQHGETTRRMFPTHHIRDITNGIHAPTWTHPAIARLFDAGAPFWRHAPEELVNADQLGSEALWAAHQDAKGELLKETEQRCGTRMEIDRPLVAYARRMTGYKRPDLLFSDLDRLRKINRSTPFQIVVSGKAHPRDEGGKAMIERVCRAMRALGAEIPCAFLPGYDMDLAKRLVTGADVWLNTPLPPLEASGTSGMKAALNGGLNLSVLDGWWGEGWIEGVTGWAIGERADADHHAAALYDKLGDVVLPLYYENRERWTWMMKQAISKTGSRFNSQHMMRRYASEAYLR